ncbi:MAG: GNAT family N-acetyltransferase [Halorhabdus sp.]
MHVEIRTATVGDAPSLGVLRGQAIEAACSDTYDRQEYAELVVNPMGEIESWINDDATTVLVAENEITPVAYAVLDEPAGEIRSIATSTDYQREGVGSAVLDRLLARAREIDLIELHATAPTVAVGFFEAQGFDTGEEAEWYGLPARRLRTRIA